MRKLIAITLFALLSIGLCSCSTFDSEPQARIAMQAASYLNPDVDGRSSPLVVTLYQLKTPFSFKQASFSDLIENAGNTLSTDLVDKQTIEVEPKQSKFINLSLSKSTHYLGVVAAYRDIDKANWRKLITLNHKSKHTISIVLQSQGISVQTRKGGWL